MGREVFVVFFGKPRDAHAYERAHESPWVMTLPLVFLAILSVVGGWFGAVPHFLDPRGEVAHNNLGYVLLLVPLTGFGLSALIYAKASPSDAPVKNLLGSIWTIVENKFYFDELYLWIVKYVQGAIAATCELFDHWILQRLGIGGLVGTTSMVGRTLRLLQTGNIQSYAFLLGVGVAVLIYCVVMR
jgi:NADH-quinone oxidoreductase subunit L